MYHKNHLLALFMLLAHGLSYACINKFEIHTKANGEIVETHFYNEVNFHISQLDKHSLEKEADQHLKEYKTNGSLEELSDYAANLIYLGELQNAKNIYHEIEGKKPDLYATASNLGTIYELIGKPDSALFWIKKSMKLNPDSHHGTEWIHVKILEFKLNGSNNSNSSILGLDFGNGLIPENKTGWEVEELFYHIQHQLRERTKFVKPENQIVGNLYYDLGNAATLAFNLEYALEAYAMAQEYGFESTILNQRIEEAKRLVKRNEPARKAREFQNFLKENFFVVLMLVSILLFWGFWSFLKKKPENKNT
ncbi:MAG: hypothetical protein MRZ79_22680 [Bacteroidia bacterium]|nr:hypothetical protein [Bacteroidia bacterium]